MIERTIDTSDRVVAGDVVLEVSSVGEDSLVAFGKRTNGRMNDFVVLLECRPSAEAAFLESLDETVRMSAAVT